MSSASSSSHVGSATVLLVTPAGPIRHLVEVDRPVETLLDLALKEFPTLGNKNRTLHPVNPSTGAAISGKQKKIHQCWVLPSREGGAAGSSDEDAELPRVYFLPDMEQHDRSWNPVRYQHHTVEEEAGPSRVPHSSSASAGSSAGESSARSAPAAEEELTQEDADRLLEVAKGRMKHLRQEEEDALDANPQLPSIPEDKSNVALLDSMAETLDLMDPEAQGPYADTPQPPSVLLVTRLAPSGPASSFAPQLLVQFSQPMIELSPEGSQVPKTPSYLHHDLPRDGQWTWEDPQTLTHKSVRLPGSSVFSLSVLPDEGAKSVFGAELQRGRTVKFSTPRLMFTGATPSSYATSQDPVCVVTFNQKAKAQDIVPFIIMFVRLEDEDGNLSPEEEYCRCEPREPRNDYERGLLARQEGCIFGPTRPLPRQSQVRVYIPSGLQSNEGPLPSLKDYEFRFRVFPRFKATFGRLYAHYRLKKKNSMTVSFSNTIKDPEIRIPAPTGISVHPQPASFRVKVHSNGITVKGEFEPYTCYTVRIGKVTDLYGQELEDLSGSEFFAASTFQRYLDPLGVFTLLNFEQSPYLSLSAGYISGLDVVTYSPNEEEFFDYLAARQADRAGRTLYLEGLREKGTSHGTVPLATLNTALRLSETAATSPLIVSLCATEFSTPEYPGFQDPGFASEECKFAEQEYRITITFKDPAGNGLTWKSTDVEVSGVATVPEILEKLSAEIGMDVTEGFDLVMGSRTVVPREFMLGHFRWSQGAVELRLVDQREYSTYSWVQRAASNHGAISDGETLVLGVCNERGEAMTLAKIQMVSVDQVDRTVYETNLQGVLEVKVTEDFSCDFIVWQHESCWGISPIFFRKYRLFEKHQRKVTPWTLEYVVNTDRSLYKPGEKVAVHGAVRTFDPETGDFGYPPPCFFKDLGEGGELKPKLFCTVNYDQERRPVQYCPISHTFQVILDLPAEWEDSLGETVSVSLHMDHLQDRVIQNGGNATATVKVFRRPDFTVTAEYLDKEEPAFVNSSYSIKATALYQTGDVVAQQHMCFRKSVQFFKYAPPAAKGPCAEKTMDDAGFSWNLNNLQLEPSAMHPEVTKDTDKEGQVVHRFHYGSLGLPVPTSIQCQCSLTDASGQTWSGTDSLLVHPASEYLGLKVGSNFVMEGKDFWILFKVKTVSGELVECPRDIFIAYYQTGNSGATIFSGFKSVKESQGRIDMNFRKHGYVYLYAFFADSEGRMNMSQLMFYVSEYNPFMDKVQRNPEPAPERDPILDLLNCGSMDAVVEVRNPDGTRVARGSMVYDEEDYEVAGSPFRSDFLPVPPDGSNRISSHSEELPIPIYSPRSEATLLIYSSIFPDVAIVTYGKKKFFGYQIVPIREQVTHVCIPVSEEGIPTFKVQVTLLRGDRKTKHTSTAILVSDESKSLQTEVFMQEEEVKPGAEAEAIVRVSDSAGTPVGKVSVCLLAVDQAVWELLPHEITEEKTLYRRGLFSKHSFMTPLGDGFLGIYVHNTWTYRYHALEISLDATLENVRDRVLELENSVLGSHQYHFDIDGNTVEDLSQTLRSLNVELLSIIQMVQNQSILQTVECIRWEDDIDFCCEGEIEELEEECDECFFAERVSRCSAMMPPCELDPEVCDAAGTSSSAETEIQVRENFDSLAVCRSFATTGEDGTVRISFKTPDTTTKYRVYAFACTETQFGQAMTMLTARMDFSMRLTIPRFLHIGDAFNANITLLNFTKKHLEVNVVTHCRNFEITGPARHCRIPPNDRWDLEIPCQVLVEADSATITSAAFAQTVEEEPQELSDAVVLSLPVYLPVVPEEVVDAGVLESGDAYVGQKVVRSDSMVVTYGHLRVQVSRDPGVQLSGVATCMWRYWMDCSEQLSSSVIALVHIFNQEGIITGVSQERILKEVDNKLKALKKRVCSSPTVGLSFWHSLETSHLATLLGFHAAICTCERLPADDPAVATARDLLSRIRAGVESLAAGAVFICPPRPFYWWGYRPAQDPNVVKEPEEDTHQKFFLTTYASNLLLRLARLNGSAVEEVLDLGWEACKAQCRAVFELEDFAPVDMDSMVHMLSLSNERIQLLQKELAAHSVDAECVPALQEALSQEEALLDQVCQFIQASFEDDGTYLRLSTPFVSSYVDSVLIYTNIRTSSYLMTELVALGALVERSQDTCLPALQPLFQSFHRLARGLLKSRMNKGVDYFSTTQENGMVCEALMRYFDAFTGNPALSSLKFVYRGALVQSKEIGAGERCTTLIPMEQLDSEPQPFFVHKPEGPPVFYEIGFRCARKIEKAVRMSRNFEVKRSFAAVYHREDLVQVSEREIHVKLNSLIVVQVDVRNRSQKYHVSVVDRLPACFEFLDESLKGSEKIMHDHVLPGVCASAECSFQQRILKDHAILGYSESLYPSNQHILRYVVRVTNRGRFIMPATKVEEMYSPENYGLDIPVVVLVE